MALYNGPNPLPPTPLQHSHINSYVYPTMDQLAEMILPVLQFYGLLLLLLNYIE